ncbi:hypothetical protein FDP41_008652 [Naegleria fowleri]|uniref:Centrosomal protein 43 n=1 Tax=Naegleria fowleri TaxID=5763 RepID=A0A6A5BG81_NAEFO|nr:uncharacterized protein FDP41_008652 [Naegleria fowleri]KAF0972988.1 hypothetical protein FDP41_008652 [Naegleria fowleri]
MSLEEIKDVLKDNLEKRGVLNKIRANLRAEIFKAFEQSEDPANTSLSEPQAEFWLKKEQLRPQPSEMQFLINELIIEYLEYNHFDYSASVFKKECNQPEERFDHRFLAHELNLRTTYEEIEEEEEHQETIPLLFKIIHKLRNENINEKRANINQQATVSTKIQFSSNNNNNGNVAFQPSSNGIPKKLKQILVNDLDCSSISTSTDDSSTFTANNARGGMDPFAAKKVSDILQNSNKLSKLQPQQRKANEAPVQPQKSSRVFKPQKNRPDTHTDFDVACTDVSSLSSCDNNSEFEIGPPPKNKNISSGLPPPFKAFNDSSMTTMEESTELVYSNQNHR